MTFQIVHNAKCPFNKIDNSLRLQTRAKRNTNKQLKNKMQMSEICYSFQKLRKVYKHKKKFRNSQLRMTPRLTAAAKGVKQFWKPQKSLTFENIHAALSCNV